MRLKEYLRKDGSSPYAEWLRTLDSSLKYRVQARMLKLRESGHFGISKRLSKGIFELKFKKLGGGIRIYYGLDGEDLVILLCAGNKEHQARDIERAQRYWEDYKARE